MTKTSNYAIVHTPHISTLNATSIVVPVYGDWASLSKNIKSLKSAIGMFSRDSVLYVNDCGPDADALEKHILKATRFRRNFNYHRNPENLGFVRNCNNAVFNLCNQADDVLLLNSDAVPTNGFLVEMKKVLYSEKKIGAVCPRSNAATIFSVPMPPRLKPVPMSESYRLWRQLMQRIPPYYIAPVAHGFCILVRREVIEQHGLFDEAYGQGYGEENDFCMRIRRSGWRCAVANKSFVFHYKGRSFGTDQRAHLVHENEKILVGRYPEYRRLIEEYLDAVREEYHG